MEGAPVNTTLFGLGVSLRCLRRFGYQTVLSLISKGRRSLGSIDWQLTRHSLANFDQENMAETLSDGTLRRLSIFDRFPLIDTGSTT